jgi:hypothetical protein
MDLLRSSIVRSEGTTRKRGDAMGEGVETREQASIETDEGPRWENRWVSS